MHTIRTGRRWVAGQPISFCINLGPDNLAKFQPDGVAQTVQTIRAEEITGTYLVEIDGRQLPETKLAEFIGRDGFAFVTAATPHFLMLSIYRPKPPNSV